MLKLIYKIIDIAKNFLIKFCKLIVNKLDKKDNDSSFNSLMPKEDIDISTNKKHKDRNIKVIHDLDDEDK